MGMVKQLDPELSRKVEEATSVNADMCMQCFRCSAGCPMADEYDILPHEMMRAIQDGDTDVRASKAVWLCASCQTCNTRCPQELDIPAVIDHFRQETMDDAAVPEVARFYGMFLRNAKKWGRLYEMGLMGMLNLRDGKPFRDWEMGLRMIRKGKIKLTPSPAHQPAKVTRITPADNEVAYYPGCSLHSTGKAFDSSFRAVCDALDVKLTEVPGWTCCGTTPAHSTDEELAVSMPISNLTIAEQAGHERMVAPCAACYSRFKAAQRVYREDLELAEKVDGTLNREYGDGVEVWNAMECLDKMVEPDRFEQAITRSLDGMKVACYYGCLLTRPPRDTGAAQVENPGSMEALVRAMGGEPIDWGRKTDCCGGSLAVTHTETSKELTKKILQEANARKADLIVAACPLCQVNLDERQPEMAPDNRFIIPVLYITQLMAWALDLPAKDQALKMSCIAPQKLMANG